MDAKQKFFAYQKDSIKMYYKKLRKMIALVFHDKMNAKTSTTKHIWKNKTGIVRIKDKMTIAKVLT